MMRTRMFLESPSTISITDHDRQYILGGITRALYRAPAEVLVSPDPTHIGPVTLRICQPFEGGRTDHELRI
jgi:hypothetical protein